MGSQNVVDGIRLEGRIVIDAPLALMRLRFWLAMVVVASAIFSRSVAAQESETTHPNVWLDAIMVLNDTRDFFVAPMHFNEEQAIAAGGVVGGTVLLFPADESTRSFFARNHSQVADRFATFGDHYGRAVYGLSLSGALYGGGLIFNNGDVRMTGIMLFESIAFAGITTTVLKSVIGRSRPADGEGPYMFRAFRFNFEQESLPSGHATVAFSVSSILAARLNNVYATVGLYSLAAVTAAERIYDDEHWLSDVFLGAAIGTISGITVNNMHEKNDRGYSLRIVPSLGRLRAELIF